jgi:hypothetical protein
MNASPSLLLLHYVLPQWREYGMFLAVRKAKKQGNKRRFLPWPAAAKRRTVLLPYLFAEMFSIAQNWGGIQPTVCPVLRGALPMTTHSEETEWKSIAEEASEEMDSARLIVLVGQLCRALDSRRKVALSFPSQTNSQESAL